MPRLAFQLQLQSLQPTSALSTLRLHARVFFLYPLKYLNVLSLFIWLPDMKQYMNSCSLSALLCFVLVFPKAAAVNLNRPLSVLSAVRTGCLWFAQAEF